MAIEIDNVTWRSPNHSERNASPDSLVLHTGEGSKKSDLETLTSKAAKVSSHFYVDRAGTIYQLVSTSRVAWHAGICDYAQRKDWNARSIGIETEHKKGQDWPAVQRQALADLCKMLIGMYDIKPNMVVAHRWIAVPRWPWPRRYDPTDWPNRELRTWIAALYGLPVPDIFDYNIKKTTLPWAVVRRAPTTAAPKMGRLMPGELFFGELVDGAPHRSDTRWVKRIDEMGSGYVWYGLTNLAL